ncbi:MAG: bifunctional DNA primase/polymerase, partial [Planctomycetaceae bacterium]
MSHVGNEEARPSVIDAARGYIDRGWRPVPIPPRTKRAVIDGWTKLRIDLEDVERHFSPDDNIGLLLGEPSGWLVDVDLDCAEARDLAESYLPPTAAVTGRPSSPRSHRWYYAAGAVTKKYTDPLTRKMIVELRSTGTQTVVGPSIHPEGERYELLTGEPACVPAPMLAACVAALAEAVVRLRYPERSVSEPPKRRPTTAPVDDDPALVERRALAYLDRMSPAISGQGGHGATYAAATALVHGFGIPPERALDLLLEHYNPRCDPPWTEKELAHKVHDAATKSHERPFGWLRDAERP